jgi:hypothetical protein
VVPWRPSEDSTILQGVSDYGCKWSLIAQQLPGRSENAVRNRWHRLENAEQTRRKAIEAGLPVEGYRCRKCGHFKKGHMCLGLESVPPGTVALGTPGGLSFKRGRSEMAQNQMMAQNQAMAARHPTNGRVYNPVQHAMPHIPKAGRDAGAGPHLAIPQPQMAQPVYYYAEEPPQQMHSQPYFQPHYRQQPPQLHQQQHMPPGGRPPPLQQYRSYDAPQLSPTELQPPSQVHVQSQTMPLQMQERPPAQSPPGYYPAPYGSKQPSSMMPMPRAPVMLGPSIGPSAPAPAPRWYVRGGPYRMPPVEAPEHSGGYTPEGAMPTSPPTMSIGLDGFSEDVMEAFLQGTLYREEA